MLLPPRNVLNLWIMTLWRSENLRLTRNDRLAGWVRYWPSNPLMVGVVSSIPTGSNFIFCWNFLKTYDVNIVQKCQICVENGQPLLAFSNNCFCSLDVTINLMDHTDTVDYQVLTQWIPASTITSWSCMYISITVYEEEQINFSRERWNFLSQHFVTNFYVCYRLIKVEWSRVLAGCSS